MRSAAMMRRPAVPLLRRLAHALLLPLLLVCAQQAAFLHGLSHYQPAQRQGTADRSHEAVSACALCLACASVESVAGPAAAPVPLLAGLAFAPAAFTLPPAPAADAPARRNRGPPPLA